MLRSRYKKEKATRENEESEERGYREEKRMKRKRD
jgi:hypothetical protein